MEQNNTQPQMTVDEAKASLGIATMLQEQLMPQAEQPVEAPTEPKTISEEQPDVGMEERIMDEIGKLREEIERDGEDNIQKEIRSIKEELKKLNEEENE